MPPELFDSINSEVLIVDDEPETRELLSEFCRSLGFGVTVAPDGRAAIAALERAPAHFGIVMTDLHMPGADGFEVLKAARTAHPSCYVVMVTGYATLDSAMRAVREGAYDYLPKPFALGQLEIVLGRIRDRMALEQENRELARRVAPGAAAAPLSGDVAWRLAAIEERLGHIEDLLVRERARG
jgi:two-component system response regulator HydG